MLCNYEQLIHHLLYILCFYWSGRPNSYDHLILSTIHYYPWFFARNLTILHEARMRTLFYFECLFVAVAVDRWIIAHCNYCRSTLDVHRFVCFFAFIRNEPFLIIFFFFLRLDLAPCMWNTVDTTSASKFQWNFVVKILLECIVFDCISILFSLSSSETNIFIWAMKWQRQQ